MMSFSKQKMQEMAFQLLFSLDMGGEDERELVSLMMQTHTISKKYVRSCLEKAHLIWEKKEDLDSWISDSSEEYALERIKRVERNILRLAFYEAFIEAQDDLKSVLTEARRLTRKFGTPEGACFVQAVIESFDQKRHRCSAQC